MQKINYSLDMAISLSREKEVYLDDIDNLENNFAVIISDIHDAYSITIQYNDGYLDHVERCICRDNKELLSFFESKGYPYTYGWLPYNSSHCVVCGSTGVKYNPFSKKWLCTEHLGLPRFNQED